MAIDRHLFGTVICLEKFQTKTVANTRLTSIKALNVVNKINVIQAVTWPTNKVGHFLWQVAEHSSVGNWINTSKEDITMTMWNKLLTTLDQLFGLPNKVSSKIKKLQQGFDNRTQEHVIWFEYRFEAAYACS
jgi:hypothetical protein